MISTILKVDCEQQIALGVVLEPNTIDTQNDTISADEIEAAAHAYLVKSRRVTDSHQRAAGAEIVESYVAPCDFELNGTRVRKGSWVLGVHVSDPELWSAIKAGEYSGFSVGGTAERL
jgi:hypothetical protein